MKSLGLLSCLLLAGCLTEAPAPALVPVASPSGSSSAVPSGTVAQVQSPAGAVGSGTSPATLARGVFLMFPMNTDKAAYAAAVALIPSPAIAGCDLRAGWSTVEPAAGVFSWSAIDGLATACRAAGKVLSIGFYAGNATPGWELARVQTVHATIADTVGNTCQAVNLPVPWDATFRADWAALQTAAAAHLASTGALPWVSQVKLSGMNVLDEQLNFGKVNASCPNANGNAQWAAAGLTLGLIEESATALWGSTEAAFPRSVGVLEPQSVVSFAELDGKTALADIQAVIALERGTLASFKVEWTGLTTGQAPPAWWSAGDIVQGAERLAGHEGNPCGTVSPVPCTLAIWQGLLTTAPVSQASALEVWSGDFAPAGFGDAIGAANTAMLTAQ